ncbi:MULTISPECIES: MarR family winged helix-turn-helix transcriptional regulator [Methylocaldum]|jgi:DNA-binding MarR family transcriptional regulator|uniref:MarR family winged helix-turn-helix transcriptional regulator n=1 Tax=unclassified Methylocaldum TaxID=2622260 RepID=UPI000A32291E|nr:MarR family transcriptional regulator [Methylocaldum sp. RMAD-M]MBP1149991.1 DNA-binding MarR family transcriptional regulator [Methylocaldum sp. RMAD-M]
MEINEQVLIELRRIVRALDLQSKQLQKVGLTGSQLMVLRALTKQGPLTANQLSQAVNLSQGTITTVLDHLELKALIRRERSAEDKRRLTITLTDSGREALRHAPSLLHVDFVAAFRQLNDWEQTLILSSLQRVAGMMDMSRVKPKPVHDAECIEAGLRFLTDDAEDAGC